MKISIGQNGFKGMNTKVDAKLLPENFAQIAQNCDLTTGKLRPYSALNTDTSLGAVGTTRSLVRYRTYWLYWPDTDIDAVLLQMADSYDRLMYTGDAYPKQLDYTLMAATGNPGASSPVTDDYKRVGIAAPATNLVHTVVGAGDGIVIDTVSYVYTYVVKWGDGTEEESPPSVATLSGPEDIEGGQHVSLDNITIPSLASTGNNITHVRIYRLSTGATGEEYKIIKSRGTSATETTDFWYDIPIAKVPLITTDIFDSDAAGTPELWDNSEDDSIETTDWDNPPSDLAGLVQYQNGMLAGFSGRKICVSLPFVHYAWPETGLETDYDIVAVGVYNFALIYATEGNPYVVTGEDQSTLMKEKLPYPQKCEAAKGLVSTPLGVAYPCPDGLFLINADGGQLVTKNVISKDAWDAIPGQGVTWASARAVWWDEKYYCFFNNTSRGVCINFVDEVWYETFDVGESVVYGCLVDPDDDDLILLTEFPLNTYLVREFDQHSTDYLPFKWASKIFTAGRPVSLSCGRIMGEQDSTDKLMVRAKAGGSYIPKTRSTEDDLPGDPSLQYEFDMSCKDSIGTNHGVGVYIKYEPAPTGYGIRQDQTNYGFVACSSAIETLFQASFTINFLVKLDDGNPTVSEYLFGVDDAASPNNQVSIVVVTNGVLRVVYEANTDATTWESASAVFSNGATDWTMFTVVFDSTDSIFVYKNGVLVTAGGNDGDLTGVTMGGYAQPTYTPYIGALNPHTNANPGSAITDGVLSDFRIYNSALTAAQALALYNNVWFKEITNEKVFKLPAVGTYRDWEVEIAGEKNVELIELATSPDEL